MIDPLTKWVLRAALEQLRAREVGLHLPVAVHLSMRNLHIGGST